jgi:hypothetical protein
MTAWKSDMFLQVDFSCYFSHKYYLLFWFIYILPVYYSYYGFLFLFFFFLFFFFCLSNDCVFTVRNFNPPIAFDFCMNIIALNTSQPRYILKDEKSRLWRLVLWSSGLWHRVVWWPPARL